MKQYDIVITGSGISGLSLAHYCARAGLKTLVMEKSDRVGGCFHSHRLDGFWFELGAHTCYNSYRNLLRIIEDCGILGRLKSREKVPFRMLVDNRIKSIPSELNFLELLLSAPRILTRKKAGQTVESYYSGIVGQRNFQKVLAPALNAVPSQRANDFPADTLFKKRERRKDIMKKFTLDRGLQTVTDSIASEPGIKVLTSADVQAIGFENNRFSLTAADGSRYESSCMALAVPPSAAAGLLRDGFPEVSSVLSKIKVVTVDSVGVAVRKEAVRLKPVAGIIPSEDIFYSIVSRDTVPDENYRGFSFHFKPGIEHEAKLKRIQEVLGVGQPDYMVTKQSVLPSPVLGHEKLIDEVDRLITGKRLFLTGNYFTGLAIEDCVTRSLSEFTRLKGLI